MELELSLKITHSRDDVTSFTDLRIAKDPAGPVFVSKENETTFMLLAYLKGFRKENISIKINQDGNRIAVSGKRPVQELVLMGWLMHKKSVELRAFKKVFRIPDGVKLNRIKAKFNDEESTLRIIMPKLVKGICGLGIEEVQEEEVDQGGPEATRHKAPETESSDQATPSEIDRREPEIAEVVGSEILSKGKGKAITGESADPKTEGKEDTCQVRDPVVDQGQVVVKKEVGEVFAERVKEEVTLQEKSEDAKMERKENVENVDEEDTKKLEDVSEVFHKRDNGNGIQGAESEETMIESREGQEMRDIAEVLPEKSNEGARQEISEETKIESREEEKKTVEDESKKMKDNGEIPQERESVKPKEVKLVKDVQQPQMEEAIPTEETQGTKLPDLREQKQKQEIQEAQSVQAEKLEEQVCRPKSTEFTEFMPQEETETKSKKKEERVIEEESIKMKDVTEALQERLAIESKGVKFEEDIQQPQMKEAATVEETQGTVPDSDEQQMKEEIQEAESVQEEKLEEDAREPEIVELIEAVMDQVIPKTQVSHPPPTEAEEKSKEAKIERKQEEENVLEDESKKMQDVDKEQTKERVQEPEQLQEEKLEEQVHKPEIAELTEPVVDQVTPWMRVSYPPLVEAEKEDIEEEKHEFDADVQEPLMPKIDQKKFGTQHFADQPQKDESHGNGIEREEETGTVRDHLVDKKQVEATKEISEVSPERDAGKVVQQETSAETKIKGKKEAETAEERMFAGESKKMQNVAEVEPERVLETTVVSKEFKPGEDMRQKQIQETPEAESVDKEKLEEHLLGQESTQLTEAAIDHQMHVSYSPSAEAQELTMDRNHYLGDEMTEEFERQKFVTDGQEPTKAELDQEKEQGGTPFPAEICSESKEDADSFIEEKVDEEETEKMQDEAEERTTLEPEEVKPEKEIQQQQGEEVTPAKETQRTELLDLEEQKKKKEIVQAESLQEQKLEEHVVGKESIDLTEVITDQVTQQQELLGSEEQQNKEEILKADSIQEDKLEELAVELIEADKDQATQQPQVSHPLPTKGEESSMESYHDLGQETPEEEIEKPKTYQIKEKAETPFLADHGVESKEEIETAVNEKIDEEKLKKMQDIAGAFPERDTSKGILQGKQAQTESRQETEMDVEGKPMTMQDVAGLLSNRVGEKAITESKEAKPEQEIQQPLTKKVAPAEETQNVEVSDLAEPHKKLDTPKAENVQEEKLEHIDKSESTELTALPHPPLPQVEEELVSEEDNLLEGEILKECEEPTKGETEKEKIMEGEMPNQLDEEPIKPGTEEEEITEGEIPDQLDEEPLKPETEEEEIMEGEMPDKLDEEPIKPESEEEAITEGEIPDQLDEEPIKPETKEEEMEGEMPLGSDDIDKELIKLSKMEETDEQESHGIGDDVKEATDLVNLPEEREVDEYKSPELEKQKHLDNKRKMHASKSCMLRAPLVIAGSALFVSLIVFVIRYFRVKKR